MLAMGVPLYIQLSFSPFPWESDASTILACRRSRSGVHLRYIENRTADYYHSQKIKALRKCSDKLINILKSVVKVGRYAESITTRSGNKVSALEVSVESH
jgi:hypothetical protein